MGDKISKICFSVLALACGFMFPAVSFAQNTPALDTTNFDVDVAGYVPLIAAALATIIATCLGVYFLIRLVRGGMRWANKTTG